MSAIPSIRKRAPAASGTKTPAEYAPPVAPEPPGWTGWLSRRGLLQRELARSGTAAPVDHAAALERRVRPWLVARRVISAGDWPLVRDALSNLVWLALERQDSEAARHWLHEFDRVCPQSTRRVSLRWRLLRQLHQKKDLENFLGEAKRFLADEQLLPGEHPAAITRTIRIAYELLSPQECEELLNAAHARIQKTAQHRAAVELCRCPNTFRSRAEAESWESKIDPSFLRFSKLMRADALLVSARAAEWRGQFHRMERKASAAVRIAPHHPAAHYWLARARLARVDQQPLEQPSLSSWPTNSPDWRRLGWMLELASDRSRAAAKEALLMRADPDQNIDGCERDLLRKLWRRALTAHPSSPADEIEASAALCAEIEVIEGRLPWTQLTQAIAEIMVRREYGSALERLESPELAGEPLAQPLFRLTRLMRGAAPTASETADDDVIAVFHSAIAQLQNFAFGAQTRNLSLRWRLDRARRDVWAQRIPMLTHIASVLSAAITTEVLDQPLEQDLQPLDPSAPPWVHWLYARTILRRANSSPSDVDKSRLDLSTPAVAWLIEGWCSRQPSAVGRPVRTLLAARKCLDAFVATLPEPFARRIAMIRRWRREPDAPAPEEVLRPLSLGEVWGLGESWNAVCDRELQFETEYLSARSKWLRRAVPEAVTALECQRDELDKLPVLVRSAWENAIEFSLSVALFSSSPDRARQGFERLRSGPYGSAACLHLSALAISARNVEEARQWASLVDPEALPEPAALERVRHLADMLEDCRLQAAECALALFEAAKPAPDHNERVLTLALLEPALTASPQWPAAELTTCARLVSQVELFAGALSWTQFSLAVKEIQVDRNYAAAIERLSRLEGVEVADVRLRRTACLLAGRLDLAPEADDGSPLGALEWVGAWLVLRRRLGETCDSSLLNRLGAVQGGDAWCAQFPDLADIARVFQLAMHVGGSPRAGAPGASLANEIPWLRWLEAHSRLIGWDAPNGDAPLQAEPCVPAVASLADEWWAVYGPLRDKPPAWVSKSREQLTIIANELPTKQRQAALARHDLRASHFRGAALQKPQPMDVPQYGTLDEPWNEIRETRTEIESWFVAARRALARDDGREAAQMFAELLELVRSAPVIIQRWWEPAVVYWRAAACARFDLEAACADWRSLCGSPMWAESCAQLALAAIQRGSLEEADEWLSKASPSQPAATYARGLLLVRRGNLDEAYHVLESIETAFGSLAAPYDLAARRLLAISKERAGHTADASRLYRQILKIAPQDATTNARMARLFIRQGPPTDEAQRSKVNALIDQWLEIGGRRIDWCRSYQWVQRLQTEPAEKWLSGGDEGSSPDGSDPVRLPDDVLQLLQDIGVAGDDRNQLSHLALLQIIARRLLEMGRAGDAFNLSSLAGGDPLAPWHRRTQVVLGAWNLLTRRFSRATDLASLNAELEHCRAALHELPGFREDSIVQRWHALLSSASGLSQSPSMALPDWSDLAPWPVSSLPALWSQAPERRRQAAEVLAPLLSGEEPLRSRTQHLVLKAVVAQARGDDRSFEQAYRALESVLDEVPLEKGSLWLVAAHIWYRNANWKQLLDSSLPAPVADLSDPRVSRLLAAGHVSAALKCIEQGDKRSALERIQKARDLLKLLNGDRRIP